MKKATKRTMRRILSLMLVLTMLVGMPGLAALAAPGEEEGTGGLPELKLWYDKPASQMQSNANETDVWQQYTLPIGNGIIGANFYGEIATERLALNEQTLWLGGPSADRPDYMGGNIVSGKGENGATIKEIQRLFAEGSVAAARNMRTMLTGAAEFEGGYGYYAPWGELRITTNGVSSANSGSYERWLSLDDGLAGVSFTSGSVTYKREYLVSNPHHVLAVKLTADAATTFTIALNPSNETAGKSLANRNNGTFNSDAKYATTAVDSNTLKLCGQLADNQLKFASYLKAVPAAGTSVSTANNQLTVTGTEVTLFFSAATDYKAVYPNYRSGETDEALAERVKAKVDTAASDGYETVRNTHMEDYKGLMGRMTLNLGQEATAKTTDALLAAYNNGTATPGEQRLLEVMLFQYGRYLTVASSRQNSILPSNLQGIWNNRTNPPWHSDFHTNVNLQMNYWPTYVTNLTESADPIVRYIDSLREPGRVTAKVYAGIESSSENPNGFMAHTQNTPYGWTCPGWSFDWGWSPGAIAWMLQNCWEYYEYTGDVAYMKQHIYPMMKEYTRLYEQMLVDITNYKVTFEKTNLANDNGPYYATVPAYSPETGPATVGNAFEQALVWQLLEDTITAAEVLGVDADKVGDEETPETWKYIQAHLLGPVQIGDSGQIKEWFDETTYNKDANNNNLGEGYGHRHISHMLGLFPGDLIQLNDEWVEAARWSMNNRTFNSTGWGMGHRINVWARLRDAENCHRLIQNLFSGGMYKNLWDAHPPFQIDGNFAYTAGVAEMLMQSNMGYIDLLPALPNAWATGSFNGLVARGNFLLSADWADKNLTTVDITSQNGGECVVAYPGLALAKVTDADGNLIEFTVIDNDKISFNTAKGMTYTISEISSQDLSEVENFVALRTASDSVTVSWTEETGKSYQLYRQVDGSDIIPVGDENEYNSGSYDDATAYDGLPNIQYYISVDGGALAGPAKLQDLRNMERVDDQYSLDLTDPNGSPIVYGGSWGTWNKGATDYMTTCRFVEAEDVNGQTATLIFLGKGIQAMGHPYNGNFTMSVDGEAARSFTTTASDNRNQVLGEITDLDFGIHTVVLTLGTGKIDFDGFNVLGGGTLDSNVDVPPEEEGDLIISTVGGVTHLWEAGDTVQFTASLDNVTWDVTSNLTRDTDCARAPHKYSWDADTQTLKAGYAEETVTVTAHKGDKTSDPITITIIPSTIVTIVEEDGEGITFTGSWSRYTQNATFHGGGKTDGSAGASYSYTFTGTGVAIIIQKNGNNAWNSSSYTIVLDGNTQAGSYSSFDSDAPNTGLGQQVLFEAMGLENKSHTIKVTGAGAGVNLDCIEIYAPNGNEDLPEVDLTALMAAVKEAGLLNEESYTAESWSDLVDALETAAGYLNDPSTATEENVAAAVTAIETAIENLDPKLLTPPENLEVIAVGGTSITLKWDAVEGATEYELTVNGKTYTTTATVYQITGLDSSTEYSFTVKAVNEGGRSEASKSISETTLDTVAPSKVTDLTWDSGTNTLSWTAATDNVAVTKYIVRVNGVDQEVTTTSTTLTLTGDQSSVTVIAVDAAGNKSVPATLIIAPEYTVTVNGSAALSGSKTAFKKGEAVTVTATVAKGSVITGWTVDGVDGLDEVTDNPLTFSMPAQSVTVEPVIAAKNWTVTQRLTNLNSTFTAETISHEGELTLTLSSAEYRLPSAVSVTMGGEELRSTHYIYSATTGTLTIAEVTGDVVIVAAATERKPIEITSITLAPTTATIYTNAGDGHTVTLSATVLPEGAGTSGLQWTSSAASVATVNQSGVVTGVGNGNATITVTAPNNVSATATITVKTKLTAVSVNGTATEGKTVSAVVSPSGATAQYRWIRVDGATETDINGATASTYTLTADDVGKTVKVSAVGTGSYEGTVTSAAFGPVAEATSGEPEVEVTGVKLDKSAATIMNGDTTTLVATVSPANATDKTVIWTSEDSSVATVDANGVVTGVGAGTATITATTQSGNKTASCAVTVVNVMLDKTSESVKVGETVTLTATVSSRLSSQAVNWTSSDDNVATVDANGVVTGVSVGTVTITATTVSGNYTATCSVKVTSAGGGSVGGGISGGSSAAPTPIPQDETWEDGTTVTNKYNPDGSLTKTVEQPDGTTSEMVTTRNGDVTITVTDPDGEEIVNVQLPAITPVLKSEFIDLDKAPWAESAINNVAALGLVNGVGGGLYDTNSPMTRGSLATVLYRLSQGKPNYKVAFRDVASGKYYTEGVAWAAKANVVTGYTADTFAPDDVITRGQLAVMLARYAKLIGLNTAADVTSLDKFVDGESTADWAVDGVAWCVEQGILQGKGQDNLDSGANVTRAEVAVMLDRFIALIK